MLYVNGIVAPLGVMNGRENSPVWEPIPKITTSASLLVKMPQPGSHVIPPGTMPEMMTLPPPEMIILPPPLKLTCPIVVWNDNTNRDKNRNFI
jgi:hypothetical protein